MSNIKLKLKNVLNKLNRLEDFLITLKPTKDVVLYKFEEDNDSNIKYVAFLKWALLKDFLTEEFFIANGKHVLSNKRLSHIMKKIKEIKRTDFTLSCRSFIETSYFKAYLADYFIKSKSNSIDGLKDPFHVHCDVFKHLDHLYDHWIKSSVF